MEVYILDSLLRREQVVDTFESFIWTERWNSLGDFELRLPSTLASRSLFIPGVHLAMNESFRVMTVETVEDTTDDEGMATLTVKGRSLEAIMENRAAKESISSFTNEPNEKLRDYGYPQDIVRNRFLDYCVNGRLSSYDKMPFYQPGTFFPADTVPAPPPISIEQEPSQVYELIQSICETYELGFRLVRKFDTSQLYFDVYTGVDRTTAQTAVKPIIFAPALDNLHNTTELTSIEDAKNVAYVYCDWGSAVVLAEGVEEDISGFDRRVLLVKSDNPPEAEDGLLTNEILLAFLTQKGNEALAEHRASSMFDGELSQNSPYKYGVDYNVGDKVEVRNADGVVTVRRVTEQIFVSDPEGERSYPTLSEAQYNNTDTWLYQDEETWADKDDTEYWATQ